MCSLFYRWLHIIPNFERPPLSVSLAVRVRRLAMSMLMRLGGMSSVFAGGCIAEKVLLGPFLKRFAPALLAHRCWAGL